MVGTTEREVATAERDPTPWREEVEEIFSRIENDLPGTGLTRDKAHYCFAGIRTIPLRRSHSGTARLSRKHLWIHEQGILTLAGGKYTTAAWTAREGIELAFRTLTGKRLPLTKSQKLPGSLSDGEHQRIDSALALHGYSDMSRLRLLQRLGARASRVTKFADGAVEVAPGVTVGEVRLAIQEEHAQTLEDLMRRRLELEYLPGHGLAALDGITAILAEHSSSHTVSEQVKSYQARIVHIKTVLKSAGEVGSHR